LVMLIRRLPQVLSLLLFTSAFGICQYASRAAQTFEIGGKSSQPTQQAPAKKGKAAAAPEGNGLGGFEADVLEKRLRLTAGGNPIDCGDVQVRQTPRSATQCARRAFSEKKPFIVRYWLQGIDSEVGVGLAGTDSGSVFAVEFDSLGWDSHGLTKREQLVDQSHSIVERCPVPVRLTETPSGRLTCFPPDRKAKRNIMSPNVESY
jgi:hypothetical protein